MLDSGSYPETVSVGGGRSLTYQDFVAADGTGPAIVDGGAGTTISVAASGAGAIAGLTLRSNSTAMFLDGPVELDSNTFDDPDGAGTVVGVPLGDAARSICTTTPF